MKLVPLCSLALILPLPSSAQTVSGRVAAPIVGVPALPGVSLTSPLVSPSLHLSPVLTPSFLPSALPVLQPAPAVAQPKALAVVNAAPLSIPAAVSREAVRLEGFTQAIAPDIQAVKEGSLSNDSARGAGERIFSPFQARPQASEAAPVEGALFAAPRASGLSKRSQPLIAGVSYAEGVSAEHQALLAETLSRRKAGWTRELARMGLKLEGPGAPAVTVRSAAANKAGDRVIFTVDWKQSETNLGSFKAVIALKTLQPALSRLPDPPAAEEKQLTLRFRKTMVVNAGGLNVEAQVTAQDIEKFLEEHGLRVLTKGWDGIYKVAVTGAAEADKVARELSGQGLVVYATPVKTAIPEERRLQVVFKKKTVVSFGGLNVETGVNEGDIGALLRELGLRVLSAERDGAWTVGVEEGRTAAQAAASLETAGIVLYATPLKLDIPWQRQLVLTLHEKVVLNAGGIRIEASVSEDDLAGLLRKHGLSVIKDMEGALKVAVREGASAADAAKALSSENIVKSALALGGVTDEQVKGAAQGTASYKGRPWSSTEYNYAWYQAYHSLELRGATPEQLKLFEKLTAEAPVRGGGFNPWSGD